MMKSEASERNESENPGVSNGNAMMQNGESSNGVSPNNDNDNDNIQSTKRAIDVDTSNGVESSSTKKQKRTTRSLPIAKWDSGDTSTNSAKPKAKPKQGNDDLDDMSWICAECKEADYMMQLSKGEEFLICDGNCHRVFHYPCAGLSELPKSEEDWICKDCTNQQHQCAFCHEYGKDDEDVFSCRKPRCGLFFHESCLAMHNVEVNMVRKTQPNNNNNNHDTQNGAVEMDITSSTTDATNVPDFTCPAHSCWTCTQKAAKEEEEKEESNKPKTKKKKKKKKQSIFQCKTETRLFRCLYCPWAFHASCIPPPSRFHELAVLCHEHASTHKLPDLDLSTSLQSTVEDKIDRKILKMNGVKKARRRTGPSSNPFFPGIRGDRLESQEKYFLEYLTQNEEEGAGSSSSSMMGDLRFCLPCDVKNEVHSKPPSYKHAHCLRFDPNNRPKRIPTGETCHCKGTCGDDCFNRILCIECYGDGQNSNCHVGGADCGNRSLGKRQYPKCNPKREGGKGWGLITVEAVPKGKLVGEYVGEVIDEASMEKRLVGWNKEHPNDPNFYVMALSGGWYIDAREYANMSRFINHSCDPNCSVMTVNVKGYKRCGIFSNRDIAAGEFLSYDYQFDTKQDDRFLCRCGAKNCRGTMKGGLVAGVKKPLNWKDAKARYELDKKFLEDRKAKVVISQVSALIPAAEQPTDFVFAGPPERHRDTAIRNRIFLWRNANRGADFVARNSRLDAPAAARKQDSSKASNEEMDILSVLREHNSSD